MHWPQTSLTIQTHTVLQSHVTETVHVTLCWHAVALALIKHQMLRLPLSHRILCVWHLSQVSHPISLQTRPLLPKSSTPNRAALRQGHVLHPVHTCRCTGNSQGIYQGGYPSSCTLTPRSMNPHLSLLGLVKSNIDSEPIAQPIHYPRLILIQKLPRTWNLHGTCRSPS